TVQYVDTVNAQTTTHPAFPTSGAANRVQLVINGAVTPVRISEFNATQRGAGVDLEWTCTSEFQNAGFNLYRRGVLGNGSWSRVNPALIAGRITHPDEK